jgi:hypothetical protein
MLSGSPEYAGAPISCVLINVCCCFVSQGLTDEGDIRRMLASLRQDEAGVEEAIVALMRGEDAEPIRREGHYDANGGGLSGEVALFSDGGRGSAHGGREVLAKILSPESPGSAANFVRRAEGLRDSLAVLDTTQREARALAISLAETSAQAESVRCNFGGDSLPLPLHFAPFPFSSGHWESQVP